MKEELNNLKKMLENLNEDLSKIDLVKLCAWVGIFFACVILWKGIFLAFGG